MTFSFALSALTVVTFAARISNLGVWVPRESLWPTGCNSGRSHKKVPCDVGLRARALTWFGFGSSFVSRNAASNCSESMASYVRSHSVSSQEAPDCSRSRRARPCGPAELLGDPLGYLGSHQLRRRQFFGVAASEVLPDGLRTHLLQVELALNRRNPFLGG